MFGVDLHIGVVVGRIEYDKHVFVILFYLDYVLGSQNIFGVQVMHPEFIDDTRDRLRISQTANLEPVDTISVDKFFGRRFVCLDLPCVQSVGIVLCEADPGNGIMLAGIEISVARCRLEICLRLCGCTYSLRLISVCSYSSSTTVIPAPPNWTCSS